MKELLGLIAIGALAWYLLSPGKLEDRPDYKKGYEAGYDQGFDEGVNHVCARAEDLKDSIHTFLQDSGVCP